MGGKNLESGLEAPLEELGEREARLPHGRVVLIEHLLQELQIESTGLPEAGIYLAIAENEVHVGLESGQVVGLGVQLGSDDGEIYRGLDHAPVERKGLQ